MRLRAVGALVTFADVRFRGVGWLLIAAMGLAGASRAGAEAERRLTVQFENVEITKVLEDLARATGQGFAWDSDVRGRMTIVVPTQVTVPEALEILDAALLMKGLTAVPMPGGLRKVVPIQSTASSAPWRPEPPRSEGGAVVTTRVRIHSVNATEILTALEPLVAKSGLARVYEPANSLILAGTESRLRRLLTIIEALDNAGKYGVVVLRLRHRSAAEISDLTKGMFGSTSSETDPFSVVVDERTNALILEGSPERLAEIRAFVRELDVPAESGGTLNVLRVLNAKAEELAELLRELASPPPAPRSRDPGARRLLDDRLSGLDYTIAVNPRTNSLLIRSSPHTFRLLAELAAELDRSPTLISVEVLVSEVSNDDNLQLALDTFVPVTASLSQRTATVLRTVTSGGTSLLDADGAGPPAVVRFARSPLLLTFLDPSGNPVSIEIPRQGGDLTAEATEIHARTLMNPHLLIVSGEEHEIFAGNEVPIPVTSQADPANPGLLQTQQSIDRQDVGVRLHLRPVAGEQGDIRLALELEVTDVVPSVAGDATSVGVTIRKRRVVTTIRLDPGGLAVIVAGSREQRRMQVERRVPFLSSIPVLGLLFRGTEDRMFNTQLVVAVQARRLRSRTDVEAESIRRRLAFERNRVRLRELRAATEAPYAVLVTTRLVQGEAEEIAQTVSGPEGSAKVVAWDRGGRTRFDVYITGFQKLSQAARAASRLEEEGWTPALTVVPESDSGA